MPPNLDKSSINYHNSICNNLQSPLSKADILGKSFPNWFTLNQFIKFVDSNLAPFFVKPFYTPLFQQYSILENTHHFVDCRISYTPKSLLSSHSHDTKYFEGYLFNFSQTKTFFIISDIYEWNDIKEEADKFRPVIKTPTYKPGPSL